MTLLLILLACADDPKTPDRPVRGDDTGTNTGPTDDTGTGPTDDSGTGPTDDSGTGPTDDSGTGPTDDSGTGTAPVAANWVVTTLEVGGRNDGFDLDGDGDSDNAIWVTSSLLDPVLAAALDGASRVVVIQLSGLDDWSNDSTVGAAILPGEDTDADPTDNASGSEVFSAGATVDAAGLARVSYPTALVSGAYEVELATESLTIGTLELQAATGVFIAGAPEIDAHAGQIGFGVDVDALITALVAVGAPAEVTDLLEVLADIDTDADGTADAVSMAFTFESVACGVSP